jgi:hypothetical protein
VNGVLVVMHACCKIEVEIEVEIEIVALSFQQAWITKTRLEFQHLP